MTNTRGDRFVAEIAEIADVPALPRPRTSSTWVDRLVARVTPGSGAPATHAELRARNDRAATAFRAGHYDDAEQGFGVVATHCHAVLGADHPDTLVAAGNLAAARVRAGRPEQAVGLLEQAVDTRTRVWGPMHPLTLDIRNALGVALHEAGAPGAAAVLRDVLADRSARLGITHPDTEDTRDILARVPDTSSMR